MSDWYWYIYLLAYNCHRHAEREKIEERIRAANDAKSVMEREVLVLK
jgi:hypothetical protein